MNVDFKHLEQYLQDCLAEAIDKVAEEALNYLTEYILKNWYNSYEPRSYKRTYDFLRSASKTEARLTNKNTVQCLLFFDTSKINAEIRPGRLNAHASFDGSSVTEKIPGWIERGHEFLGRGYESLGSMESTIKMLERDFPRKVAKELRKMGLQVKVEVSN